MKRSYIFLVAVSLGMTSATAADISSPKGTVAHFLVWESKVQPSGAYRGLRTAELNALLSEELLCLLDAAATANELSERAVPDEKPPFIEGNLFLPSAWERPSGSEIVTESLNGSQAVVEVRFKYEPDGTNFTSKFSLLRFFDAWRITEISRGGQCDFCQSGELRASLYATLRHFPKAGASECRKQANPALKRRFAKMPAKPD